MLTLDHVTKEYGNKTALSDITLTFPDKGLVIVCGESGCGKTTLLNIASGADLPSFGKVFWCGCEINASNVEQFRRGKVSDVYQDFMLVDEMSCAENIRLAAEACGKSLSDQDVLTLLSRVGLKDEHFSKRVSLLSGGEKERNEYLSFLSSGGSKYPIESLRKAGVDMSTPEPVNKAAGYFGKLLDEFKSIRGLA